MWLEDESWNWVNVRLKVQNLFSAYRLPSEGFAFQLSYSTSRPASTVKPMNYHCLLIVLIMENSIIEMWVGMMKVSGKWTVGVMFVCGANMNSILMNLIKWLNSTFYLGRAGMGGMTDLVPVTCWQSAITPGSLSDVLLHRSDGKYLLAFFMMMMISLGISYASEWSWASLPVTTVHQMKKAFLISPFLWHPLRGCVGWGLSASFTGLVVLGMPGVVFFMCFDYRWSCI